MQIKTVHCKPCTLYVSANKEGFVNQKAFYVDLKKHRVQHFSWLTFKKLF